MSDLKMNNIELLRLQKIRKMGLTFCSFCFVRFGEKMISMLRELSCFHFLPVTAPTSSGAMAQDFLGCRTTHKANSHQVATPLRAVLLINRPDGAISSLFRRCPRPRLHALRSPAEFERASGDCSALMI